MTGKTDGDCVLVGPARSGTTLACSLLNQLPDVVALDEPFDRAAVAKLAPERVVAEVADRFARERRRIASEGRALSTVGAAGLGNHYADDSAEVVAPAGLRRRTARLGAIAVSPSIGDASGFRLVVKHTLFFACHLDELARRHPVSAIVRNPLAVLLSWSSIDADYRHGRVPGYLRSHVPDLDRRLTRIHDRARRQVELLQWHFERFEPLAAAGAVLTYEDLVDTGGRSLRVVVGRPVPKIADLDRRNANPAYDRDWADQLATALLATPGPIWDHYTPGDIHRLLDQLASSGSDRTPASSRAGHTSGGTCT